MVQLLDEPDKDLKCLAAETIGKIQTQQRTRSSSSSSLFQLMWRNLNVLVELSVKMAVLND